MKCSACERGPEACEYCEHVSQQDWEAICDCGLYDFGQHLIDCRERDKSRYVIAGDWTTAELPR